jgi:transcription elongation factor GreA
MASFRGSGPAANRGPEAPIYLTAAGRQRLQDRLAADLAQRERFAPRDPTEVRDSGDEADRLEAADERSQIEDRIAATQDLLARAQMLRPGPDDGVIRLGSTVQIRDSRGQVSSLVLVDPVEIVGVEEAVAVDSAVGMALLGHKVGDHVRVSTPDGHEAYEVIAATAYRPT